MWGKGQRGNNAARLALSRLLVTSPNTHKQIGPFGHWFLGGWVGLCIFLDPVGPSNELSCEAESFSCHLNPHRIFTARSFKAFFSGTGTLGCMVCLATQLFLPVYPHANVGPPAAVLPSWSSNCHLATSPLCPGFLSLSLLPIWMNVSSLTPWLPDFYTVRFSGSSGVSLFLNLLFFLFWEEAKFIYLRLHLVQKSIRKFLISDHPMWLLWDSKFVRPSCSLSGLICGPFLSTILSILW